MKENMMKYFILFLIWDVNEFIQTVESITNVNLKMALLNEGFHRNLYYSIDYPTKSSGLCKFLIEQELPASVYINTDELDDLKRFHKLDTIHPSHVNVELPTELSQNFKIFLHSVSEQNYIITLPIHFRYHYPNKTSFTEINFSTPLIYYQCKDTIAKESFCLNELELRLENGLNCNWAPLKYDILLEKPLTARIPLGDITLQHIVKYITIISSWIGCIIIILAINKKMNELENKKHK